MAKETIVRLFIVNCHLIWIHSHVILDLQWRHRAHAPGLYVFTLVDCLLEFFIDIDAEMVVQINGKFDIGFEFITPNSKNIGQLF
jgi:hypothetical protein